MSPRIKCEAGDQADFGYGDSEWHECQEPATHRVKFAQVYFPGDDRALACARHAADLAPGDKSYRFRSV